MLFAGTGWRLVCRTVTQVQGVCLTGLVGDLWRPDAGLVERKTGFKELVDRMGRWPGYGGSAVAMGEWPAYGDLPKRMGEPRYRMGKWPAWKAAESHGGAAKTYGKYHRTWETAPAYGEAARPYGEPKITSKPEILERWAACGLADFNEFLVGGGGPAFATVKASHRACCECRGA